MKLLSINSDSKTIKGLEKGYLTGIQYLAPHKASGVANLCGDASPGCIDGCLFTAGRAGIFEAINRCRIERTILFKRHRKEYAKKLHKEIVALIAKGIREGLKIAIRLNGTSDLPWEKLKLFSGKTVLEAFPLVQFYDYTKSAARAKAHACGNMPGNYHLTFSRSETNDGTAFGLSKLFGGNVAIVFAGEFPKKHYGRKVINGDLDDLRFLDPARCIVGLKAKGKAKKDESGFVVEVAS